MAASRFGPVLKVSEDGIITFFDGETGLGHLIDSNRGFRCTFEFRHCALRHCLDRVR